MPGDDGGSPLARLEADLALQAAGIEAAERDAVVADLLRAERSSVPLADRLRAQPGSAVVLHLVTGSTAAGAVHDVGADHVVLDGDRGGTWVPWSAVVAVEGLGWRAAPPAGEVAARWTLAAALRRLAADAAPVRAVLSDGRTVVGRCAAVGADHVDVALDGLDAGAPARVLAVPFAALLAVHGPRPD